MRAICLLLLVGCAPELERRPSLIERARIIAIATEPAESKPGEIVRYVPWVAAPEGTVSEPAIAWAMCRAPKAPTESRSVSPACLDDSGVLALGIAGAIDATTPEDVCFLFGPDTPPGDFRPRDPDSTGGYYLPMRAALESEPSFALHRIRCNLANAPVDVSLEYAERYLANQNPVIEAFDVSTMQIAVSSRLDMALRWSPASAERYLVYDPAARTLVEREETLRVSWFATAGHFDHDATGEADNAWSAPDAPATVHFWAVLRDERGGTAVANASIDVAR